MYLKLVILFSIFLLLSCNDNSSTDNANNTNNTNNTNNINNTNNTNNINNANNTNNINNTNNTNNIDPPLTVTVLGDGTEIINDVPMYYQQIKLVWGDKDPTYILWVPPKSISPVVMLTIPYDQISWTGDPIDEAQPNPIPVSTHVEMAFVTHFHGFGTLLAFGRFYTDGSIQNDVDDMTSALKFLKDEPLADNSKIAIWGGSWGGFEALYGAANAPEGAVPIAGCSLAGVSGFDSMVNYVHDIPNLITDATKVAEWQEFFAPYIERVYQTTGGAPGDATSDYNDWTTNALAQKLNTPFLTQHEMWDTLVSISQSENLVNESNGTVSPIFYLYDTPLDYETHELSHGNLTNVIYTFMYSFLFTRIGGVNQPLYILHWPDLFHDFMIYIRDFNEAGNDMNWIIPRFEDLMDDRILMYDGVSGTTPSGKHVLVDEFNADWCITPPIDEVSLATMLSNGIPPSQCK